MKTNVMQIVRLVMMIVAVAGIIYALEYMERGIAVWFWITLLGVGFVGLLYTFRLTQRRALIRAGNRQGTCTRFQRGTGDLCNAMPISIRLDNGHQLRFFRQRGAQ